MLRERWHREQHLVLLSTGQHWSKVQQLFIHGSMLLPSSAEVSQGYPNGDPKTLTGNAVVTYRKLFLPLIFASHDSQHNRKHRSLRSVLINSLTGSLLWFKTKTDYFYRLSFMANTRSEQQFCSVTAIGTTDSIPQPNNIIFICFPLHSKFKRSIFAQRQWKPTSVRHSSTTQQF